MGPSPLPHTAHGPQPRTRHTHVAFNDAIESISDRLEQLARVLRDANSVRSILGASVTAHQLGDELEMVARSERAS